MSSRASVQSLSVADSLQGIRDGAVVLVGGFGMVGHLMALSDGLCELVTKMGGRRIIQKPYGEQLPRIC